MYILIHKGIKTTEITLQYIYNTDTSLFSLIMILHFLFINSVPLKTKELFHRRYFSFKIFPNQKEPKKIFRGFNNSNLKKKSNLMLYILFLHWLYSHINSCICLVQERKDIKYIVVMCNISVTQEYNRKPRFPT